DPEAFERGRNNLFGFGEPSGADHATREISAAGLDDVHAAAAQDFHVRLRGRMLPHVDVHGGSDDHGGGGGEIEGAEKIVGDALCELGQDVSGGGSDQER